MTKRWFISTTSNGIARLVEGGAAAGGWDLTEHLQNVQVHALAAGPRGTDRVLAGATGGVFRSDDRGGTWDACGLEGAVVMSVAVAPSDPDRLYAGVRPRGFYRSMDAGATWTACESFQRIRGRRVWRSPASPPFTAYVQAIAVSPADPDLVVAGIEFGAVVRSTDGGERWSNHRRRAIRDCHALVWHETAEDRVYESGAGIPRRPGARSTDGGETWIKPRGGSDRGYGWSVAAHPADPDVWYVSASTSPFAASGDGDAKATIFRHEGGTAWTKLETFPGERMAWSLCTDPDHLWAGRSDGSIYRSADRGDTWSRLEGVLPSVEASMVILPP